MLSSGSSNSSSHRRDLSQFSSAYSHRSDTHSAALLEQPHEHTCSESTLREENIALRQELSDQKDTNTALQLQVECIEAEKRLASKMYEQLLERVNTFGSQPVGGTTDPIVATYLQPDTFPLVDPKTVDNPQSLFFLESDWKTVKNKKHGVLEQPSEYDSSPFPYLVSREGVCASNETVAEMRQKGRSVFAALKVAGHCPVSWGKADEFAISFFYRALRSSFEEFRLCELDWKASQFAIRLLPQWQGKPKDETLKNDNSIIVKSEPSTATVKLESASRTSTPKPMSSNSKRPPSMIISAEIVKKSRLESACPGAAASSTTRGEPTAAPPPDRHKYAGIKILNPLSDSYRDGLSRSRSILGKENIDPNAMTRSTTTYKEHNDDLSDFDNSNDITLNTHAVQAPPMHTATDNHSANPHLQALVDSLYDPVERPAAIEWMPKACTALPSTEKAKAKVLVNNGTLERRKSKLQNPNASLHVTKSTTARNLCAIAYKNENKGRTVTSGEYAAYWDGLTAAEKQKWFDQQELCGKVRLILVMDANFVMNESY
ncbi:hypothetical protein PAXINDRAFT_20453 [Paxillus involutus ATCC 200175]|uniref:Uncharacterized protein n=1 Tax=Paxillus involutus ATCC 200175 TaxID=664439 RepID=A0A0C9TGD5_PAXIN|nr:hypothetical protein PAXINDRAFT_20453 [Paxillus involutus ATCC 200175]